MIGIDLGFELPQPPRDLEPVHLRQTDRGRLSLVVCCKALVDSFIFVCRDVIHYNIVCGWWRHSAEVDSTSCERAIPAHAVINYRYKNVA